MVPPFRTHTGYTIPPSLVCIADGAHVASVFIRTDHHVIYIFLLPLLYRKR